MVERVGEAGWYGQAFDGRTTANGERFDMYRLTAASADLPLDSYAAVTNLATGETVVVRINDRPAPDAPQTLITLAYAAAHRLGVDAAAPAQVKVSAVGQGAMPAAPAAELAAAAPRLGWFSGLRLSMLTQPVSDAELEGLRTDGPRALFRKRASRSDIVVTWAQDEPAPLAGL
ncbi:MAG: septal ring lytic transglycosylase RlpA family lipoprotein [Phenylobacterium sp.]|nr:septal ring lytic transglycosylase RlpA family lipoprotein [Phenylobacterium sp.]